MDEIFDTVILLLKTHIEQLERAGHREHLPKVHEIMRAVELANKTHFEEQQALANIKPVVELS